jgi:cell division protein FtsN
MKKFLKNSPVILALIVMTATLLMGGCFRKSINTAPPAKHPATRETPAPIDTAPSEITEDQAKESVGIIEETYEVDAVEETLLPQVAEDELGDDAIVVEETVVIEQVETTVIETTEAVTPKTEVAAEATPTMTAESTAEVTKEEVVAAATAPTATAAVEKTVSEPSATPEDEVVDVDDAPEFMAGGNMYYVQVGAFSKSINAENVLKNVIAQGFEGSKITMSTKGLYLVRVGEFTNKTGAKEALGKLKEAFPSSYIVKWNPAAK